MLPITSRSTRYCKEGDDILSHVLVSTPSNVGNITTLLRSWTTWIGHTLPHRIRNLQSSRPNLAPCWTSPQICIALVCRPIHFGDVCQPQFIMSRLHWRMSLQRELLSENLPYTPFYSNCRMACSSSCIPCSTTGIVWPSSSNERTYFFSFIEQTWLQRECTLPCLSVQAFDCLNSSSQKYPRLLPNCILCANAVEYILAAPVHFGIGLLVSTRTAKCRKSMIISFDSDCTASKRYLPVVHRLSSFDWVYLTSLEPFTAFVNISAGFGYNCLLLVAYQHTSTLRDFIRSISFCYTRLTLASSFEAVVNYIRLQLVSDKTRGPISSHVPVVVFYSNHSMSLATSVTCVDSAIAATDTMTTSLSYLPLSQIQQLVSKVFSQHQRCICGHANHDI